MEGEGEGGKKKRSFSYEIGDQKLKLIDISSEEDCLISLPLFDSLEDLRLSVTLDHINESGGSKSSRTSSQRDKATKVDQQKELKFSSASIHPGRPSYFRKSFAWDNAFFTNSGLLDQHELSSMSKGFDTLEEHLFPIILEDVRARRPNLQSISNIGTSECCEVYQFGNKKLPMHGSNHMLGAASSCCEAGLQKAGLQNVLTSKKVGTGSRDMIDRRLVSKRKNIQNSRAEKSKTEQTCKKRDCNSRDLKLPKVPRVRQSASTWQSKMSSLDMYPVDIGGKKRTGAGRDLMVMNSTTCSLSSQKISPSISSITSYPLYETSAYARKRTETAESKFSASASLSSSKTPRRSSTKSKRFENLSSSTEISVSNHSSKKSPTSTTSGWFLEASSSTASTNRAHSDSNFGLNMTFEPTQNYRSPSQLTGAVASVRRENIPPSGICMPSPKIGFFDEDKSMVPTLGKDLNRSQKQGMGASIDTSGASTKVKRARRLLPSPTITPRYATPLHKVKNASSRASDTRKDRLDIDSEHQTDKSVEIDCKVCSKLRKVGTGEHDRKKVGLNPSWRADERPVKEIFKTKQGRERMVTKDEKGISGTSKLRNQENEVNDLSRYLELIDLNDGKEAQLELKMSSSHRRAPLIEKNSICNRNVALGSELESAKRYA